MHVNLRFLSHLVSSFKRNMERQAKEDIKKKSNKVSLKINYSIRKKYPVTLNISLVQSC